MYNKLLGMLKPHIPDVEQCCLIVEKLIDFIEKDRELEVEKARDEGLDEGYDDGLNEGRDKGYDDGLNEGHNEGYDEGRAAGEFA